VASAERRSGVCAWIEESRKRRETWSEGERSWRPREARRGEGVSVEAVRRAGRTASRPEKRAGVQKKTGLSMVLASEMER